MLLLLLLPSFLVSHLAGADRVKELRDRVDASIAGAYQSAAESFPCKVKTRGKPKMLRWEEVDRCLNGAADRVDWKSLAGTLATLRSEYGRMSEEDFRAAVESSFSAHALTYDKVFAVKDPESLLPLTNSLLKFLPADSLQGLAVFDKVGTRMGKFLGTYAYERTGGLASANTYLLTLFQYTDRNGNVQPVGEKLLLDSYGVPWKDAMGQRGFRLSSIRLVKQ